MAPTHRAADLSPVIFCLCRRKNQLNKTNKDFNKSTATAHATVKLNLDSLFRIGSKSMIQEMKLAVKLLSVNPLVVLVYVYVLSYFC